MHVFFDRKSCRIRTPVLEFQDLGEHGSVVDDVLKVEVYQVVMDGFERVS